jgi:HTH-type transcriptional regulator/antitoxin HigA
MEGVNMITVKEKKTDKIDGGVSQIPETWNDLGKFLRPIHTKKEYDRVIHILDNVVGRTDLTKDQEAFVESLSILVEAYENEHEPINENNDPVENLKLLLEANNMNLSDLGHLLGSRSLGSLIMNRKRGLSKNHIRKLCKRFSVSPNLFL